MDIRRKLWIALGLVGLALVSQAGSASGAVTIGSDLSQVPDENCADCAILTLKTSSGADLGGSPVNGTLISARVRSTLEGGDGSFRVLRPTGAPLEFLNAGEAPVSVTADASPAGHITEVQTHIPIKMGDRLGIAFPGQNLHYLAGASSALCAFRPEDPPTQPVQPVGTAATYDTTPCSGFEVLVAGTVDPDNSFTVGTAKSLKNGKARLVVTVPNAGVISATAGGAKGAAAAMKGEPLIKSASATAGAPGALTLTLKPSSRGRQALARKGRLRTPVKVSFTPNGGTAASRPTSVRLKKKR